MIAVLVWCFRVVAACVVLPVVARAVAAGQYLGALLLVAVLVLLCSAADTDERKT